jgi:hypothetical protein
MSLKEIFNSTCDFFEKEKQDYAIIGAFALYGFGYVRATKDIDFVVRLEIQKKIIRYFESLGFSTLHCSDAFSNHLHPLDATRVDFMYVDAITADKLFSCTQKMVVFNNRPVPVVAPQHLIAMKLFSAGNNPDRKLKDLSDVREIVKRAAIDEGFLKECLKKNGLERYYEDITG